MGFISIVEGQHHLYGPGNGLLRIVWGRLSTNQIGDTLPTADVSLKQHMGWPVTVEGQKASPVTGWEFWRGLAIGSFGPQVVGAETVTPRTPPPTAYEAAGKAAVDGVNVDYSFTGKGFCQ